MYNIYMYILNVHVMYTYIICHIYEENIQEKNLWENMKMYIV